MHVVELAVSDTRLAAAVAQAPLTDGLAAAMMSPLKNGSRLFGLALLDRLGSLFGRPPIYIPGHGRPGDLSIGATPDGPFGEKLMTPKDGTRWHDRVAARSLLSFSWRRPVRRAASVRVPFLLVVPEADAIVARYNRAFLSYDGPWLLLASCARSVDPTMSRSWPTFRRSCSASAGSARRRSRSTVPSWLDDWSGQEIGLPL
jgi:hypothetical protein